MDSKSQFYALEVMCRERAAVARKDLEYWLAEAEEWAQLRISGDQPDPPGSNVSHSAEPNDVTVAIVNLASFLRAANFEGVE
ncbi:MAG: hypothetical protein QOI87_3805 [Bradyrhizobium sp.]|jgi:hypothetical protein|nr:hypothetical protein [Bradyrhizobium sp.]